MSSSSPISHGLLTDFDWKLCQSLSSSHVHSQSSPLLSLKLMLQQPDGSSTSVVLELSREELDKLIKSMVDIDAKTLELQDCETAGGGN